MSAATVTARPNVSGIPAPISRKTPRLAGNQTQQPFCWVCPCFNLADMHCTLRGACTLGGYVAFKDPVPPASSAPRPKSIQ
jgi:hypothetical protein